jgi:carboxypeptidase C (cathepsin A)
MTASSLPVVPDNQQQPPPKAPPPSRRGIKIAAGVVGGLVLLGAGFAAGEAAGRSPIHGYQQQIAQAHRNLTAEQLKLSTEKITLTTEQGQVQTAQAAAQNAMSTALAQVKAQYKSKLASVQALQRQLRREQGIVQTSTISSDGVYVIGKDIPAGIYHTSGGNQCYYATLASTDTNNINDNNNFNGPETVDVSAAYAFQITGGCTWVKVG